MDGRVDCGQHVTISETPVCNAFRAGRTVWTAVSYFYLKKDHRIEIGYADYA